MFPNGTVPVVVFRPFRASATWEGRTSDVLFQAVSNVLTCWACTERAGRFNSRWRWGQMGFTGCFCCAAAVLAVGLVHVLPLLPYTVTGGECASLNCATGLACHLATLGYDCCVPSRQLPRASPRVDPFPWASASRHGLRGVSMLSSLELRQDYIPVPASDGVTVIDPCPIRPPRCQMTSCACHAF